MEMIFSIFIFIQLAYLLLCLKTGEKVHDGEKEKKRREGRRGEKKVGGKMREEGKGKVKKSKTDS